MRRIAIAGVMVLAGGLLSAAPASAGWIVQGIPGTSCHADNRGGGSWEYRGRKLLNTGTVWTDLVVAVCPMSLSAPGWQPREYRIQLNDSQRRDTWCKVYAWNDTLAAFLPGEGGTWVFNGQLQYPLAWPVGLVEGSVHCLLHPGASLERIEIVWYQ
jgi:hypothetical protein